MHESGGTFRCVVLCVNFLGFVHLMIGILVDNLWWRGRDEETRPASKEKLPRSINTELAFSQSSCGKSEYLSKVDGIIVLSKRECHNELSNF